MEKTRSKITLEALAHREGQLYIGTRHEQVAYERGFIGGYSAALPTWFSGEEPPKFGMKILAEDVYGRWLVLKAVEGDELDNGTCLVSYVDENEYMADDVEVVRWTPLEPIVGDEHGKD